MATSAALVERTVPPSSPPPVRAGPPAPSPPKKTLPIERFMASAIWRVRIEPEAPTSMPPTISAVLSSARPAAAAESPVKALSVEITTGMSAPPIGSTASTPSAPAASRISQNSSSFSLPAAMTTASATAATASRPLTAFGMRKRPLSDSCSFRNATFEPQNEIEPMIAAKRIGISSSSSGLPPTSSASRYSTTLISATAPPPTPLNSATICGIAVIFTLRAAGIPTAVPTAIPTAISGQSPISSLSSVAITAIAMPTAATRFPRTAVRGPRSMCSPTMKSAEGDDVERDDQVIHLVCAP